MNYFRARKTLVVGLVMTVALGLVGVAAPAPAWASSAVEYNLWVPFADDFDSCTGERVFVSGVQHIVGRSSVDGAGRLHFGFTRHTQGTGVGEVSGAEYLLIDSVTRAELLGNTENGATTFTEGSHSVFIRRGEGVPGDDLVVHMLTHYMIAANGELTADVEITDVDCR